MFFSPGLGVKSPELFRALVGASLRVSIVSFEDLSAHLTLSLKPHEIPRFLSFRIKSAQDGQVFSLKSPRKKCPHTSQIGER